MKQRTTFLKIFSTLFFLILFQFLSTNAQTVADLQNKYGKPVSVYEIRPGIMAVFKFDDAGQVSEIRVERYNATEKMIYLDTIFSDNLIEEVINELAPADKRGNKKRDGDSVFMGGVARKIDEYEKATINFYSNIGECSEVVAIIIKWKSVSEKKK